VTEPLIMSAFQGSYIVCCRDRILGPIDHELPYPALSGLWDCFCIQRSKIADLSIKHERVMR
jgi:hypothetical protein